MLSSAGAAGPLTEERLLELLAEFDDAYFNLDADALRSLLASDVIFHADHLTIEEDLHGPDAVLRIFKVFFANYQFKHLPVVRAVNTENRSGFCLWEDDQVLMKAEKFDEELPASGSSTNIAGIWKLAYDQDGKVQHIFCLRQLTREEKKYRLKLRPNQTYVDFSAGSLLGPELQLTPEQVARMADAASRFNEVWRTGEVGIAHDSILPTAHTVNPILGEKKESRADFEQQVEEVFKYWEVKSNSVDIAVTPASNKAFVHWSVTGVQKDNQQENSLFGLNLLVFEPTEGKITEVVGFRQPLISEHDQLIKAGPYSDKLGAE